MRRTLGLIIIGLVISLLTTGLVLAREMIQGEQCLIEADEVIEGSLFTFCQNLIVAGRVEGNIIGIALQTDITGEIMGNVYIVGTQLNLTGIIRRDLHYAGIVMDIQSSDDSNHRPVRGQIIFATLSSQIGESIIIPGRITGIGYQLLIDAEVNNEVNFWGSALIITNTVDSNVYATVGNPESDASDLEPLLIPFDITQEFVIPGLTLSTSGTIKGDLTYIGTVAGEISGTVDGLITYTSSTPVIIPIVQNEDSFNLFVNQFIREISVLLTVGVISLAIAPATFQTPISNLRWRPVPSFVIGMLMFIVSFPIALILLLITVVISLILILIQLDGVLIVVSSFLILLDVAIIGGFYFIAIFIARATFALGLGRFLVRSTVGHDGSQRMNLVSLIVGVLVISFLAGLPGVGFLFNAAALFMGLGAITNVALEWLQTLRNTSYHNVRSPRTDRPPLPPRYVPQVDPQFLSAVDDPHTLPAPSNQIGLTDLPAGFDVDFFFTDD